MPNIDVPIEIDLKDLFNLPPCDAIKLPGPKPLKVNLPTGGTIQAFSDISKGIPTDCALTFSLMLQIAPMLASMQCLLNILKLLKPLIKIIKDLPAPPGPEVIYDFGKAAGDVAHCFLLLTPEPIGRFIKDLLCLIIRALNCFLGQMKFVLAALSEISLQMITARSAGDDEMISTLECAQNNVETQAQHLTASIEPIGVILDLAGAFFDIAGVPPIKLPAIGSQTDVESISQLIQTIQGFVIVLQTAADLLGGCE